MLSTTTNVAESKQVEGALEQRDEKYRTILETIPDPVVLFDIECKVEYFNPAFTSVFGWTLEECFGKSMNVFVPEDAWPEIKTMSDKLLAGKSFSGIETRCYTKEGNIIHVSISGAVYRDREGNPKEQCRKSKRYQRTKKAGKTTSTNPEDGSHRYTGRWHCSQLQQPANGNTWTHCLNAFENWTSSPPC